MDGVFAMPKTYGLKFKENEVVKIKGFNAKPDFNQFKEKFYKKEWIITKNSEWSKKDFMIKNIMREKKLIYILLIKENDLKI